MKCPDKNCGPYKTPTLKPSGYFGVLFCRICKKYYDEDGKEIEDFNFTNQIPARNGGSMSEEEWMEELQQQIYGVTPLKNITIPLYYNEKEIKKWK